MTPICTKDLGTDEVTGLDIQLQVWQLTIDAKSEVVLVNYDIALLAPNGAVANILRTENYTRYNFIGQPELPGQQELPANMKFNELRESALGQTIAGMIAQTINDYPNVQQVNLP